ncbi:MAG: hypothetical protein IT531_17710 [Burkholderiales bacterium]|nr:hypothetical protein [Burkholderiales bacterium]
MRSPATTLGTALALTACCAGGALGQVYPAKSIRVVIGYSAAGPTDVLGRIVAQKLAANVGQTMLGESRPGASSIIGAELVAKSDLVKCSEVIKAAGVEAN